MPPVKAPIKVILERLLNTRFTGDIGSIKVEKNPNVWSNYELYSDANIPGDAATDDYKKGIIAGTANPNQFTFSVARARWRKDEYKDRYLYQRIAGADKFFPITTNDNTVLTVDKATVGTDPISTESWKILTVATLTPPTYSSAKEKHKRWLVEDPASNLYDTDSAERGAIEDKAGEEKSTDMAKPLDHDGIGLAPKRARRLATRIYEALVPLDSGARNLEMYDVNLVAREVLSAKMGVFERKSQVEVLLDFSEWCRTNATYSANWKAVINEAVYDYIDAKLNLDNPDNHDFY